MTYELYNDDFFNVLPEIKEEIDLCVFDLPYGQTKCEWDSKIDLNKMWEELRKVCKPNCIYVFFCTTKFGVELINSKKRWFAYDLVWQKHNAVGFFNCNKLPLRSHEMIYIFKNPNSKIKGKPRGKMCYNPQKTKGKPYMSAKSKRVEIYGHDRTSTGNISGDRFPKSVIKFNRNSKKTHPTAKPVKLLEWLIKTYSYEGETILDITAGSMSAGVACINTNRKFIGIEMDKEIFKMGKDRMDNHKTG